MGIIQYVMHHTLTRNHLINFLIWKKLAKLKEEALVDKKVNQVCSLHQLLIAKYTNQMAMKLIFKTKCVSLSKSHCYNAF